MKDESEINMSREKLNNITSMFQHYQDNPGAGKANNVYFIDHIYTTQTMRCKNCQCSNNDPTASIFSISFNHPCYTQIEL